MADLMASGMPDGTRVIDRGLVTFLLESQNNQWHIVRALRGHETDFCDAVARWPRVLPSRPI